MKCLITWKLLLLFSALIGLCSQRDLLASEKGQSLVPVTAKTERVLQLPPHGNNPRNSEGDFITLKDGRILFIYTHFTGGAADHSSAFLAGRYSSDGGKTWTQKDQTIIENDGKQNIMSVSLLRLQSGQIALFYARKNSIHDLLPVMRLSNDEGAHWSEPVEIIPAEQGGYYVLNNDRVIQLKNGRIVIPLALHQNLKGSDRFNPNARFVCYYSDDNGKTWQRGEEVTVEKQPGSKQPYMQEPGVVELKDGRLMGFCRTNGGSQYVAYSQNGGKSFSKLKPSNIISPVSPASIERIPATGDLLLVWNNHRDISPQLRGKRTPLTIAVSKDEGKTWEHIQNIETNPNGWYCYTAIEFTEDGVLLGHCAGDRTKNNGLAESQITLIPLTAIYEK
ncbi:sialidase family protein [uncultured Gimesia sp.]|uniref:sialidase family protein n=1 Tax=uncultured Gimesia sp. TaxID=1678688 RepID=UPI0030D9A0AE|tara:strand:+ start:51260 stop:52435 length:1176 start_codon:yes stop_codon:yes gene_type:complete